MQKLVHPGAAARSRAPESDDKVPVTRMSREGGIQAKSRPSSLIRWHTCILPPPAEAEAHGAAHGGAIAGIQDSTPWSPIPRNWLTQYDAEAMANAAMQDSLAIVRWRGPISMPSGNGGPLSSQALLPERRQSLAAQLVMAHGLDASAVGTAWWRRRRGAGPGLLYLREGPKRF
jgi:hypothetical protein